MKQGTHKGCPYSVYVELRYLIIKKTTKSIRMAQVAHVAPLGLGRWDIPSGYKHVAPPGLKTHYPISLCFRVSLVPMEGNHKCLHPDLSGGCPYNVSGRVSILDHLIETTRLTKMTRVAHVAPLGLRGRDIPRCYKHVAPLGLKTHYPISLCFRVFLVPMEDNHKLSVAKSRFIGEVTPTGMSPIPVGCWKGRGNPAPTQQSMDFQRLSDLFLLYITEVLDAGW